MTNSHGSYWSFTQITLSFWNFQTSSLSLHLLPARSVHLLHANPSTGTTYIPLLLQPLSLAHSIGWSINYSYPSAFAFSLEVTCSISILQQVQLIWTHFTKVLVSVLTFLLYRIILKHPFNLHVIVQRSYSLLITCCKAYIIYQGFV